LWPPVNRTLQLLKLNARVARLALGGRWIGHAEVANGYNKAAPTYNLAWQKHLRPVTDELLQKLPGGINGTIIDLGSGTGYAARLLANLNPNAEVIAVDISSEMLEIAAKGAPPNLVCIVDDMLAFLRNRKTSSADMIVSTWALGYSDFPRLFQQCSRVLVNKGTLGFIVNYADTLNPIFSAFSECMLRFPERVKFAAWPRFPKSRHALEKALIRAGFQTDFVLEGKTKINLPATGLMEWLRHTGILSGFDKMLDLDGPPARLMEELIRSRSDAVFHHYAMAVAHRQTD